MNARKTAVITGATSGLGEAAALALAKEGYRVLIVGRDAARGAEVVKRARDAGGDAEMLAADLFETERGILRYVLLLRHDIEKKTVAIMLEELSLDEKPAYRFANGEVQLYSEGDSPGRGPFPFSPQRSFLAFLDPEASLSPIAALKAFLRSCWSVRLDPAHIEALAPKEDDRLFHDSTNFAAYCRYLLQEWPEKLRQANEALREIIPGFQHLRTQAAGRARVLMAAFQYPGGNAYDLDFDTLSDGQKALIVLYVLLHGAVRDLPILCLDEPDNFVSLREIQPFLVELDKISDETGLQVLLVSHSAEVIDYMADSGAILFERPDGGHTRVRTIEANGALPLSQLMARGWLPGGMDEAS